MSYSGTTLEILNLVIFDKNFPTEEMQMNEGWNISNLSFFGGELILTKLLCSAFTLCFLKSQGFSFEN